MFTTAKDRSNTYPNYLGEIYSKEQTNFNTIRALHEELKGIKKGGITVSFEGEDHKISATWNESQQSFTTEEINFTNVLSGTNDAREGVTEAAARIAEILNVCAQRDREIRRADNYSLADQDRNYFLRELLTNGETDVTSSITIAHGKKEETVTSENVDSVYQTQSAAVENENAAIDRESTIIPESIVKASTVLPKKVAELEAVKETSNIKTSTSVPLKERPVIVYGFDYGYRKELINNLKNNFGFRRIQKMQNYMQGINIGTDSTFEDFCDFLEQATKEGHNSLHQRIITKQNSPCRRKDLETWADFLKANIRKFDFFTRLGSEENRKKFFFKNCDLNKVLNLGKDQQKGVDELREAILAQKWKDVLQELSPGFELLENMNSRSLEELKAGYQNLTSDQKKLLDVVLLKAFLRKTSKLGLAFAQQQGITVLFAWTSLKREGESVNLEELHDLLEVKPYKFEKFRINLDKKATSDHPLAQYSPEATTFSEMREMFRLRQKGMVPSHILVREIKSEK